MVVKATGFFSSSFQKSNVFFYELLFGEIQSPFAGLQRKCPAIQKELTLNMFVYKRKKQSLGNAQKATVTHPSIGWTAANISPICPSCRVPDNKCEPTFML